MEASTSWVFLHGVESWDYENFKVGQALAGTQWFSNAYKGKEFFSQRKCCMEAN